MSYLTQKTIKNPISFKGIGLHTGLTVSVCIKPAGPDTGIVFKRIDLKTSNLVYPNFMNVSNTSCLLYTSPSPRDATLSRMPSSA